MKINKIYASEIAKLTGIFTQRTSGDKREEHIKQKMPYKGI